MRALTVVARNYLPQARVLAASFLEHHPGAEFFTLVIDGTERDRDAARPGTVLLLDEIGLDRAQWQTMAAIYDVMEFATAVKPAAVRSLLAELGDDDAVAYIDPDIRFYAPIHDVFSAAVTSGVVLTPHVLDPLPRDGRTPDEAVFRFAGIFNLGFVCVGRRGIDFLDWWHERLRTDAVVSPDEHLFTDQRWVDWVPALFEHHVARDPGLNVAYWNVHERHVTVDDDGVVRAAGSPLRFFHFSGYDPSNPWWLSKHSGARPRTLMSDEPTLRRLCGDYGELLRGAGWPDTSAEYGFARSTSGVALDPYLRRALRRAAIDADGRLGEHAPNPFVVPCTDFDRWLSTPVVGPADAGIGPWERELRDSRPDLRIAFPDVQRDDARPFRHWLDNDPWARAELHRLGHTAVTQRPPLPAAQRQRGGWNVVGYHTAELGVGEAGRRIQRAIEAGGLPTATVGVTAEASRREHRPLTDVHDALLYRDSIYCVNADEIGRMLEHLEHPERQRGDARRMALWFWELDEFPTHLQGAAEHLDEVWVASEFCRQAIQPVVHRPVRTMPLPVAPPPRPTAYRRGDLGLPQGFLFSFSFDFNSVVDRKNPAGVIAAFLAAFGPADGAVLVIKTINGHRHLAALEHLRWSVAGRPDIVVIDGYWSHLQVQALLELSDCFVSLHRSEGFGLHLADAMAAGTPVIATAYGGNMDFMDDASTLLVPYRLVDVGPGHDPYPATSRWAEPDLHAAAEAMRRLFDDPALAAKIGELGRQRVLDTHSLDAATAAVVESLHPGLRQLVKGSR